jgi:hypothetical protein
LTGGSVAAMRIASQTIPINQFGCPVIQLIWRLAGARIAETI